MGSDVLFAQTVLSTAGGAVSGVVNRSDVELREGSMLGNYQLERLLGEGSMGKVFQARHARLGRQVALKVLKAEHARDSGFVQRFFQEARTVNQINHEHIVEIFDFVDEGEGGHVYCVMELLRGQSLTSLLQEEKLTLARIQRIVVQVCAALGAAHQVGVVHRDIKPDNLFIIHRAGQPDFVKVLDFGVAKLLSTDGNPVVNTTGTMDGTIVGTPAYMAPEQAAGLQVDPRADVYAVGNILYELLAGKPPFQAPAFGQLVVQIITQPPPPLPAQLPSGEPLPPQLAELVMRCLAKEPEARPQSLAEVTTALLLLPAPAGEPAAAEGADLSERPTQKMRAALGPWRTRGLVAAGAAVVALVSGALTWTGLRSVREPAPLAAGAASLVAAAQAPGASSTVVGPVTLTVHSFPEGAQVLRADTGEVLGVTPLIKELPGGDASLGLRVELTGYVPSERVVRLDKHAVLEVPLAKAQTAPRHTPGTSRPAARKGGVRDAVIDPFAAP